METAEAITRAHAEAAALLMALDREQQGIPSQLHQVVETGDPDRYVALKARLRELPDRLAFARLAFAQTGL